MAGYNAIPVIADKFALRLTPYDQPSTPDAAAAAAPGVIPQRGSLRSGNIPDATASGIDWSQVQTPDPISIQTAQVAAEQGDQGAIDWLKTFGLIGAIGGAGYIGARLLADNLGAGVGNMFDTNRPGMGAKRDPFVRGGNRLPAPEPQKLLPAPQALIPDQRATRFNQPDQSGEVKLIPDMNRQGREVEAAYAQKAAQEAKAAGTADLEKGLAGGPFRLKNAGQKLSKALQSASKVVRK